MYRRSRSLLDATGDIRRDCVDPVELAVEPEIFGQRLRLSGGSVYAGEDIEQRGPRLGLLRAHPVDAGVDLVDIIGRDAHLAADYADLGARRGDEQPVLIPPVFVRRQSVGRCSRNR